MAAGRDVLEFEGRRPSVIFNEGALVCAQPLAANIGLGKPCLIVANKDWVGLKL